LSESEAVGGLNSIGEPTAVTLKAIRRERLVDLAKVSKEDILQEWSELLQTVGEQSFTVKTILGGSEVVGVEEGAVILKVFYDFHREQLETEKNMRIVAGSFEKVFAIKPQIRYILGAKEEKLVRDKQADDDLAKTAEEIFR
jgi:hypothetical protein